MASSNSSLIDKYKQESKQCRSAVAAALEKRGECEQRLAAADQEMLDACRQCEEIVERAACSQSNAHLFEHLTEVEISKRHELERIIKDLQSEIVSKENEFARIEYANILCLQQQTRRCKEARLTFRERCSKSMDCYREVRIKLAILEKEVDTLGRR